MSCGNALSSTQLGAPSSMGTPKKRGVDESVLAYSPLLKSPVHVESDSELVSHRGTYQGFHNC